MEAAVCVKGRKTLPDVSAYWMMPPCFNKVNAEVCHRIDFTTGAAKIVQLASCISVEWRMLGLRTNASPKSFYGHEPTLSDLLPLLQKFESHSKTVCLSGMGGYYHRYIDPVKPHLVTKPQELLCDSGRDRCNLPTLYQYCSTLTHLVAVTGSKAAAIEAQTQLQYRSATCYASSV